MYIIIFNIRSIKMIFFNCSSRVMWKLLCLLHPSPSSQMHFWRTKTFVNTFIDFWITGRRTNERGQILSTFSRLQHTCCELQSWTGPARWLKLPVSSRMSLPYLDRERVNKLSQRHSRQQEKQKIASHEKPFNMQQKMSRLLLMHVVSQGPTIDGEKKWLMHRNTCQF